MKIQSLLTAAAGLAALAGAVPASAQHVVIYGPRTDTSTSSSTHQGPHVATSNSNQVNGTIDTYWSYAGNSGSYNGGGSTVSSWSTTEQFGGVGDKTLYNTAYASANLATGELKASTASTGGENYGTPMGGASARFDDTVFFTNTSGNPLVVSLTYAFDGSMSNPFGGNPGGSVSLGLSCTGWTCYNGSGDRIGFANNPSLAPDTNWNYYWDYNGGCFGENIYCGQGAAPNFQYGLNTPFGGSVVDGWISTSLLIPTGESSLGLRATLNLDCRSGSSCDFGHTGTFRFGDLPTGLTFSSASGALLSAVGVPPNTGAVPEPATWLMMILGFGFVGALMRRRPQHRPAYA